jgi:hypothetical protein
MHATTHALDLTAAEADVIANASRGEFLIKATTTAGARSYRVRVDLHPWELSWWDTTAAMHATPTAPSAEHAHGMESS